MKTTEFIEKVEAAGFSTLKLKIVNAYHEAKPYEVKPIIYVCKDDENALFVGEFEKWLVKTEFYKFDFLTATEKDALMPLVFEYIATDPENRI